MTAWATLDGTPTRIIAHRGASGVLPEHTIAGYALALQQGADVIEPDLLLSKGEYQLKPDLPFTLGVDFAGVVRSAPAGSGFSDGDRVAACLGHGEEEGHVTGPVDPVAQH